jgi:hypothetical protein
VTYKKKVLIDQRLGSDKDIKDHNGAVVPAAAEGILSGGVLRWCVNGLPVSVLMGTTLNGLYSFTQNNL